MGIYEIWVFLVALVKMSNNKNDIAHANINAGNSLHRIAIDYLSSSEEEGQITG